MTRLAFDEEVEAWCERCGHAHTMHGQVEPCAGCGGNRFVFRKPAFDEGRDAPCRCVYPDKCFCPPEQKPAFDEVQLLTKVQP